MEPYVRKGVILAGKYRQGLEDGFSVIPVASLDNTFTIRLECDIEGCVLIPYIETPGMGKSLIRGDEFIVSEDGCISKYVMKEEDFNNKFMKASKWGKKGYLIDSVPKKEEN